MFFLSEFVLTVLRVLTKLVLICLYDFVLVLTVLIFRSEFVLPVLTLHTAMLHSYCTAISNCFHSFCTGTELFCVFYLYWYFFLHFVLSFTSCCTEISDWYVAFLLYCSLTVLVVYGVFFVFSHALILLPWIRSQIYNEQISDLLKPERNNLTIREDKKKGVFVEGLSEWVVRCWWSTELVLTVLMNI